MPLRVRRASPESPDDVAALAALRFAWHVDEHGSGLDETAFAAAFGGWWRTHADTHQAWVAERDGVTIGMAWLATLHRLPAPRRFVRLAGMVQSAYVLPAERDGGVGASLLAAVVAQARRDGHAYLTVHPSERSYSFYQRAGFADTGRGLELGITGPRLPTGTA